MAEKIMLGALEDQLRIAYLHHISLLMFKMLLCIFVEPSDHVLELVKIISPVHGRHKGVRLIQKFKKRSVFFVNLFNPCPAVLCKLIHKFPSFPQTFVFFFFRVTDVCGKRRPHTNLLTIETV